MSPQKLAEVRAFIDSCRIGVLGTLSASGVPQTAVMGLAISPDLEIIFDTLTTTRKYANLKAHKQCAFSVWKGEIAVQYEGIAEELRGDELARYQEIYFTKMPDGRERLSWPGITYFVVRPTWLRHSDYDARPPRIEEHTFL
ncbi:MAG TPA: pyridoxamine 5'-phosphate oxidase family protein [Bryobacteraceae bacterium]|nr:pyridoxamine 5'-phosphate oxidase family protein [Bryobacteraceae bacterium]